MADQHAHLRVALLAGMLQPGGAEKQLVYMARALRQAGVNVRVYSLTQGEFYESALRASGLEPIWMGQFAHPLLRLAAFVSVLRRFHPHFIQSTHSYTNLYVGLAGRLLGSISLGALRSSLPYAREVDGVWSRWLISTPTALLANSQAAVRQVIASRLVDPSRVYLVPNVIDLSLHDRFVQSECGSVRNEDPTVVFVGQLIAIKRPDRFLRALARARQIEPRLKALVVGDGSQRAITEELAIEIGLPLDAVTFLGRRNDVPALLRLADVLCLTSDDEGFPNVILEAMAASLPVITTPAGDAGSVVQDGVTGYVVPFDDIEGMAERMVQLARAPDLRRQLGQASRRRVEQSYSCEVLTEYMLSTYRSIAEYLGHQHLCKILSP
jgi:glycosyltransferase involved in cell wall biosynthesis